MNSTPVTLAKPSGVTLVDHTRHLREQFREHILPQRDFVCEKYARLIGGDLAVLTLQAIQWHDAGKKHPLWQDACRKDYADRQAWLDGERKGKEPKGVHLMHARIRHEMASLDRMLKNEPNISPIVQVAVAAHHGKLSHRHRERWLQDVSGTFQHLWKLFVGLSDEVDYIREFDKAILRRYEHAGPRALLQLADHRASAAEDGKTLPDFALFRYQFPYDQPQGPQKVIPDLWDESFALLRAPTGSGKTDAALLWAQRQIEQKRADRLVIAMPTRFTANSLAISNVANLSRTGLYHSSAWYQYLKHASRLAEGSHIQIDADQDMARLLETPITVTTLDHLCICLTGTREDHHAIFFNLAHSCVVIDEADFYDTFTQANMVILLRALKLLQVPVLLMSATLPSSSCFLYTASHIHEDTSDNHRIRCLLKRHEMPVVKPSDVANLLLPALDGRPTIIYANTVQRAQRYYRWFLRNGMPQSEVILYHSRFIEPDKVAIEERLRAMLGKEAWKRRIAHGVAILTQIGELSVNISADYMLSELCPLDRLVQRIGRLARFSEEPGELHLLLPHKRDKEGRVIAYPAPYGTYTPGIGWQPTPVLTTSAEMLKRKDRYSAQCFVELVDELYRSLPEMESHVRENQRLLREMVGMNWLILSGGEVSSEGDQAESGSERWRCRDIDPQVTVLVGLEAFGQFDDFESDQWIRNRREWRKLLLEHGIACQTYEFKRAVEQGYVHERRFAIGDDDRDDVEQAWLVRAAFYDPALGLCFGDPEDDGDE